MRKRDHNIFANAASLLICGLLAGVVVAAAAFPAVAMSGLAAKAGAETFDRLPSELTVKRSPQMTYVYASDGKTLIATMYDENRRDVPLKDVSPIMQEAIIAAEDHTFRTHNGVDAKGIARAFIANNSAGTTTQGASTLTMQLVRMLIAYSATHPQDVVAATEDTNARKLREMKYALQLDKQMTKDEILERYLNIAPFGRGAYGVFAASQVYFGKQPKDLKVEEAALLAGMVKAPSAFDPTTPAGKPQAQQRRDYVIDNMVETKAITLEQATAAKKVPLKVKDKRTPNGCVATSKNDWGFFCDFFYRWWMDQETFGATSYDRERRLKSGGYRIVTTLDVKTQKVTKANIDKHLKANNKNALMLAAVEPGSGRVRALAVNRVFKLDDPAKPQNKISSNPAKAKKKIRGTYPNTTNPLLTGGGDIHGYQFGSTFKMFTMVAALERGYPLETTINTVSPYPSRYIVESSSPAACKGTNKYCPENAGRKGYGPKNMWAAFSQSINTYFVPLQERAGAANVVDAAKRLGIQFRASSDAKFANDRSSADQWGAFTLGVSSATPLEMANAYATLAADGKYCEPIPVQEIVDQDGNKLDIANPRCEQRVKTEAARAAVDAARCPVGDRSSTTKCGGSATAGRARGIVGKPIMGKSGTTDSAKTASLIVGTKQLMVAGLIADPDWAQTSTKFTHNEVNDAVWSTVRDAMRGKPSQQFTPPSGKIVEGDQRRIPDVKCKTIDDARSTLRGAGFEVFVDPGPVNSTCPAGTVAGTQPESRTIKGGIVSIQISNGKGAPPGNQGGTPPTRGPRGPNFPPPPD